MVRFAANDGRSDCRLHVTHNDSSNRAPQDSLSGVADEAARIHGSVARYLPGVRMEGILAREWCSLLEGS